MIFCYDKAVCIKVVFLMNAKVSFEEKRDCITEQWVQWDQLKTILILLNSLIRFLEDK